MQSFTKSSHDITFERLFTLDRGLSVLYATITSNVLSLASVQWSSL